MGEGLDPTKSVDDEDVALNFSQEWYSCWACAAPTACRSRAAAAALYTSPSALLLLLLLLLLVLLLRLSKVLPNASPPV